VVARENLTNWETGYAGAILAGILDVIKEIPIHVSFVVARENLTNWETGFAGAILAGILDVMEENVLMKENAVLNHAAPKSNHVRILIGIQVMKRCFIFMKKVKFTQMNVEGVTVSTEVMNMTIELVSVQHVQMGVAIFTLSVKSLVVLQNLMNTMKEFVFVILAKKLVVNIIWMIILVLLLLCKK